MEKLSNPVKNSHGSKVTRNPLREWRGVSTIDTAAFVLELSQSAYIALESHPEKSSINSDQIIRASQLTGIPLPVLVDWLTETTKEMA